MNKNTVNETLSMSQVSFRWTFLDKKTMVFMMMWDDM